ncbi:MAG: hypothetical protein H6970_06775 [Gammaproteobacteria bacterium]|nr:hypothetical protein [Gammaproteobacteria bacterium]MCP5459207.1 hypothetical protein [Gammaproteobacteria bacterium]
MIGKRHGRWADRACVCGFGALLACIQSTAQEITLTNSNLPEEQWIEPQTAITLTFDRLPSPDEGQLAILLDKTDLTSLFQRSGESELVYSSDGPPLQSGSHELIVYRVRNASEWEEITRVPVNVLTPSGFEAAEVTPKVELALKAQLDSHTTGDATPLERDTYQDLELQLGVETRHKRGDFEVRSNASASGFSNRQETLRYGELGNDSPKLDLNNYLVEVDNRSTSFALGSVTYGSNPLLVNSVNNRGLRARYQLGNRFDFSVGLMNGTSIVGYNNIFGLSDFANHRIAAATVGIEWLPQRPGGLRTEFTYTNSKKLDENDFDTGEIPDAEENRGFGLRVAGSTESGRLRGEVNFARSRFTNPNDPSQDLDGVNIVAVKPSTDNAYSAQVAYDLLQDEPLIADTPITLTATLNYAYADALYRSLGAYVDGNLEVYSAGLDGRIGDIGAQLAYRWTQDNVDDLSTLLTTRTRGLTFALSIPFKTLFGDPENPNGWLPDASYALDRVHQQAVNRPDPILSGFDDPSQLPDQVTLVNALDLAWAGERWDFTYHLATADEDNRQAGREQADFKTLENGVVLGVRPWDTLNLSFGIGRTRVHDREQDLTRYTDNYSVGMDWSFYKDWAFTGSLGISDDKDNENNNRSDSLSGQAQVSYRFELPGPGGRRLPGQWFLRYSRDNLDQRDREFDIDSSATTWTINTGLSLSLY